MQVDGDTLTIPDFNGNRYFNTLGNMLIDPRAALLFIDFDSGDVLTLQGTTRDRLGAGRRHPRRKRRAALALHGGARDLPGGGAAAALERTLR